jgi:hypothetical protein
MVILVACCLGPVDWLGVCDFHGGAAVTVCTMMLGSEGKLLPLLMHRVSYERHHGSSYLHTNCPDSIMIIWQVVWGQIILAWCM